MAYSLSTQERKQNYLNIKHDSPKYDRENSPPFKTFVATSIYKDENNPLLATLHIKPTDTYNYLHFETYWQKMRMNRITG